MSSLWLRFERLEGAAEPAPEARLGAPPEPEFGLLDGEQLRVHRGALFGAAEPTGERLPLASVRVRTPCTPGKLIGLWNNYHALAEQLGQAVPKEPLYFIKGANSYLAHGEVIPAPRVYDGRVVYEGELALVIGARARGVSAEDAGRYIFGYTCINDVTALDLVGRDPAFAQWARAKSCDGFAPFGPAIATGLDWRALHVRTRLNGRERQNYPCSDMIFGPEEIVSRLSQELTLEPGDVIACGTSIGIGPLRSGASVEVEIEGIGALRNRYE